MYQLLLIFLTMILSIQSEQRQCQSISYYECKNIGYNQTYLPNKYNHQDQKDVALVVSRIELNECTSKLFLYNWHFLHQGEVQQVSKWKHLEPKDKRFSCSDILLILEHKQCLITDCVNQNFVLRF